MKSPATIRKTPGDRGTHYTIGFATSFDGPILDITMPDGTRIRRIDEKIHERALKKANEVLGSFSERKD